MRSINSWILDKVTAYLKASEGCQIETTEETSAISRSTVQDAFGFRYEVQVKPLGRIKTDSDNDLSRYDDENQLSFGSRGNNSLQPSKGA